MIRIATTLALLCGLSACGSVEIPVQRFYGLTLPQGEDGHSVIATLRVCDLQGMGAFDRDAMVVTDGVQYAPRVLERWVVPVDRMLTDAFVLGLTRHGVADLILGSVDSGRDDWRLHGRIVEFAEVRSKDGDTARVALEVWAMAGERLLFRDEFTAAQPIADDSVEAVVVSLSHCVSVVVAAVARRLRAVGQPDPGT